MSRAALQPVTVQLDRQAYQLQVLRRTHQPPEHPRLVVVAYQPNPLAQGLLEVCLRAVQRYTPEPHELWVVDNCSPAARTRWLLDLPGANLVLNRTAPLPLEWRRSWKRWLPAPRQPKVGSYANAVGLELAARLVDPGSAVLLPLHMDTLPCHPGWLSFLHSKLDDRTRAAGVHLHRLRVPEGVLHVLGFLVDFQLFRQLGLDFFPHLPELDVGDRVTLALRQAGYAVYACRNTFNQPELAGAIPAASPAKNFTVFRALDDQDQVIFLHLGRGVRKTTGDHRRGVTPQEWIQFANRYLLA